MYTNYEYWINVTLIPVINTVQTYCKQTKEKHEIKILSIHISTKTTDVIIIIITSGFPYNINTRVIT